MEHDLNYYELHKPEPRDYEDSSQYANAWEEWGDNLITAAEKEIERLEDKKGWHDLHKNSKDLPPLHEMVIVNVKGTDVIFPKPNENWKEAAKRCQKEAMPYNTLAYLEDEDEEPGKPRFHQEGWPMMVQPRAWRYLEEFEYEE